MRSLRLLLIRLVVLSAIGSPAFAAGTRANTTITNTATVDYILAGLSNTASASVSIAVDELIDVTVSWQNAANVSVMSPSISQVLAFLVTNSGNGIEDFILNITTANTPPQFDPVNIRLWEDTDRDGIFNFANDTQIPLGGSIRLDGGMSGSESALIFVVSDIPSGLNANDLGNVRLNATSVTASNNSVTNNIGAVVVNGGDGGVIDALIGFSGAQAVAVGVYEVVSSFVSISKTATVNDNRGGNAAYPGAVIRYTLNVAVAGSNPVGNLVITDIMPANTTYDAATDSIRLNGVLQTNASDTPVDFSEFISGSSTVSIDLSQGGTVSITPPASFIITFDVLIN